MYLDNKTLMILHQERIDEAAKSRLAHDAIDAQRDSDKGYNPALAWVGRRMMDIGAKMVNVSEKQKPSLN